MVACHTVGGEKEWLTIWGHERKSEIESHAAVSVPWY